MISRKALLDQLLNSSTSTRTCWLRSDTLWSNGCDCKAEFGRRVFEYVGIYVSCGVPNLWPIGCKCQAELRRGLRMGWVERVWFSSRLGGLCARLHTHTHTLRKKQL